MIVSKQLPDQATLKILLDYDPLTGVLRWKARAASFFEDGKGYGDRVAAAWNTKFAGKPALNTLNGEGRFRGRIFRTEYMAHRIIWKIVYGTDPEQIDHEDGDGTNNRLKNLRSVSHSENQRNMKRSARNSSGVIGVCWVSRDRRWLASIRADGRNLSLGFFQDFADAVAARLEAEKVHGFHKNHGRPAKACQTLKLLEARRAAA